MRTIVRSFSRIAAAIAVAAGVLVPVVASAPVAGATPPAPGVTSTVTISTTPALVWARGIAADTTGNVWIASQSNSQLIKVNTASGAASNIDLSSSGSSPWGVAVASDDSVWVGTNTLPGTLIHVSPEGTVLASYATPTAGDTIYYGAIKSLTEASDGKIWFTAQAYTVSTTSYSWRVGSFDPQTLNYSFFTSGTTDSATTGLWNPTSITEGPDGNMWVANAGSSPAGWGKSVSKITPTGTVTTYDGTGYIEAPVGIVAIGSNLYVTSNNPADPSGAVARVTTSGTFSSYTDVSLNGVVAIAKGTDNKAWVLSSTALTSFDPTTNGFNALTIPGNSAMSMTQAANGAMWYPENNSSEVRSTGIGIPQMPEAPNVFSPSRTEVSAGVDTSTTYDGGSAITGWALVASNGAYCTTVVLGIPCRITGLTEGSIYTFTVYYQNANGTSFSSPASREFIPGGSGFTALASPVRVFDTRTGIGTTAGTMSAGGHRGLVVTGSNGVPVTATAVVLNLTATGASVTSNGWAAVVPSAASFTTPTVSSLNFVAGRAFSNSVTVPVGTGGSIEFFNKNGTVNLIADLIGYYDGASGSTMMSMTPTRVFDTRSGTGTTTGAFAAGEHRDFNVQTGAGVPAYASAVVFNVTATGATDPTNGWVAVNPTAAGPFSPPTTSNLNFTSTSGAVANMVICGIGSGSQVTFFNKNGSTQIIADLVGYYVTYPVGARYFPVTPTRAFDTRNGTGGVPVAPIGTSATLSATMRGAAGVPGSTAVDSVLLNLTAASGTATSWFAVSPGGEPRTTASSLNFLTGKAVANLVLGRLGSNGAIDVYNKNGTANAIGDVAGYFASAPIPLP